MIPGEAIIALILQIVLEAMKGQTPEQRAKMWEWYVTDMTAWRKFFGMDK